MVNTLLTNVVKVNDISAIQEKNQLTLQRNKLKNRNEYTLEQRNTGD